MPIFEIFKKNCEYLIQKAGTLGVPQESVVFQNVAFYLFKGFSYYAFLQADQLVEFMCEVEDGWWKGRVGGRVGVFPS